MKKLVLLFVVSLFIVALASSCKTTDCPAYSQTEQVDVEQNA